MLPTVLPVALLGALALLVVTAVGTRSRPVPPRLAAVARSTRRWRLGGLLVGLVVAGGAAQQGTLGRGVLLAAPLVALCVLLGVVAGELRVRAPGAQRRSAPLEVRSARDYLPRVTTVAVGAATALLAGLLAFTTAVAAPDDLGRAGRALTRACSAVSSETRSPWPGSFYALPLSLLVVLGLAAATAALVRIGRRPRQGEDTLTDDLLRRQAATAVVAAVGLLVTVPLVGTGTLTAAGLLQVCAAPAAWTVVGQALLAVVPVALLLGTWCAALLLAPPAAPAADAARR